MYCAGRRSDKRFIPCEDFVTPNLVISPNVNSKPSFLGFRSSPSLVISLIVNYQPSLLGFRSDHRDSDHRVVYTDFVIVPPRNLSTDFASMGSFTCIFLELHFPSASMGSFTCIFLELHYPSASMGSFTCIFLELHYPWVPLLVYSLSSTIPLYSVRDIFGCT